MRVLAPACVLVSVQELAPALVPDLERVWVLERAEGLALEEQLVRELSTPARAWLLLWQWLLLWCSRSSESPTRRGDPSETDPAASPAVAVEPLSLGMVPLQTH